MLDPFAADIFVPPAMVADLAYGEVSPLEIAQKHGFDAARATDLLKRPWLVAEVERVRSEAVRSGAIARRKAAILHDDLIATHYPRLVSLDTPLSEVRSWVTYLARVAGIDQPPAQQANAPAFSVQIVLGDDRPPVTITGTVATPQRPLEPVEDQDPLEGLQALCAPSAPLQLAGEPPPAGLCPDVPDLDD